MVKTLLLGSLTIIAASCSQTNIQDKAGVHSNGPSLDANQSIANYKEWFFSTEEESFYEEVRKYSSTTQLKYRFAMEPETVIQAPFNEMTPSPESPCDENLLCFKLIEIIRGVQIEDDPEGVKLEDVTPRSVSATLNGVALETSVYSEHDQTGTANTTQPSNASDEVLFVKVKLPQGIQNSPDLKIEFRGNVRIESKLTYPVPLVTKPSEAVLWELNTDGSKVKEVNNFTIDDGPRSDLSELTLTDATEYRDGRILSLEYPRGGSAIELQLAHTPVEGSIGVLWNGVACPKEEEQIIGPLKNFPQIILINCPSLRQNTDTEIKISYKYAANKSRFQIPDIDPEEDGVWEVYLNDEKTGEYTRDQNAIIFNNPLPEAAKIRIRYTKIPK